MHQGRLAAGCVRRASRRILSPAIVAAAVAGPAGAQGISSGNASPDGYKLPGGFEPVLHLPTYYFDQESTAGVPSEAWALGGSAPPLLIQVLGLSSVSSVSISSTFLTLLSSFRVSAQGPCH